ncbi:MAG: glycosyltransferase, partial [Marinirhabdus sp.]|nr:glycosyltransferase [Marinirhabdus sp.]
KILSKVRKTLKEVDVFQFRGPTGIGVFVIPYLMWGTSKKGWFKYGGNWNQKNAPIAFAFQRWLLKHQDRRVTINGKWPDQPQHCLSFENPCLTLEERSAGLEIISQKEYSDPFHVCFVGRLDDAKGVHYIVEALELLRESKQVGTFHFIGDGPNKREYQAICQDLKIRTEFHGFLPRDAVFKIYEQCHFIVLPSKSEGFPKVIAEGMNYGCIPIVSDVSSIRQYVEPSGFMLEHLSGLCVSEAMALAMQQSEAILREKATTGHKETERFTYKHYNQRVLKELIT